ncbi:hypothetical protein [Nitrospirillum iridis]|uniref:Uncharacterized protein n=1 Tax=Nitrospirillum iridis TaxID=765888 RepID=A0A7X0AXN7_9PROT|nr:hypothetical protein [Nitrospirillum iridis]MBB6250566.1 hypothetical protein [Nitrospirillum iridis]
MAKPSPRPNRRYHATAARLGRLSPKLRRDLTAMEVSEQAFRKAGALALAEAVFGDRAKALAWLRAADA